jgi:hypothetical protein
MNNLELPIGVFGPAPNPQTTAYFQWIQQKEQMRTRLWIQSRYVIEQYEAYRNAQSSIGCYACQVRRYHQCMCKDDTPVYL